jgi:transketolase
MNHHQPDTIRRLRLMAEEIRRRCLRMIFNAKAGHTGGSLSATDMLAVLYFHTMRYRSDQPDWPGRDRFILSKGHSVESFYCTLAKAKFFPDSWLDTYGSFQSVLAGHPTRKVPGIELNSGALGHGLSVGVGIALAAKMDAKPYRTFVLMGDGEQGEGSVYEAAMTASHYHLDNLIAFIDRNGLQISGPTESVMTLEPMRQRWESLGWDVNEVDGNDVAALVDCLDNWQPAGKPTMIIAHTTKGKGVSFMENVASWHHGVPTNEQLALALSEIDARIHTLTENP